MDDRRFAFERAVARDTWRYFRTWLAKRLQSIPEALVTILVAYEIMRYSGSLTAANEKLWAALAAIPIGLLALAALQLLIGWATAPRRIFYAQETEIRDLSASEERPLRLVFDQSKDVEWMNGQRTLQANIRVINRSPSKSIEDVTVKITVEPLNDKRRLKAKAGALKECPLRLSSESLWREPLQIHQIHCGDGLHFRVARAERGIPHFDVQIARCIKHTDPSSGRDLWIQQGGTLDSGKYRITIVARGKDVPSDSMAFVMKSVGRTLTFGPEN
jgi:hypothetical protein